MVYAMIATVTFRQPLNFAEVDIREELAKIFLLARKASPLSVYNEIAPQEHF
jgi:hypothetical protein